MKTILPETEEKNQSSNDKSLISNEKDSNTRLGPNKPIENKSSVTVWIKAIAIPFSILIVVCLFAFYSGRNRSKPIDWVFVNALHGKQKIELPDGSRILIRKGSSVSYPSDFGKTRRYVQLQGEAYFEIMNDNLMPFNVKAKNEITASSGTSFLVRSNDSVELIIVSKGEVKFESNKGNGQYITVSAGHKAELIGNKIIRSSANNANYSSWTNEQLIFNRTPLIQVAEDIKNFYGFPVYISREIDPSTITITAQYYNLPLAEILEDLAIQSHLIFKMDDKAIFINKPAQVTGSIAKSDIPYAVITKGDDSSAIRKKKVSWIKRIFKKKERNSVGSRPEH